MPRTLPYFPRLRPGPLGGPAHAGPRSLQPSDLLVGAFGRPCYRSRAMRSGCGWLAALFIPAGNRPLGIGDIALGVGPFLLRDVPLEALAVAQIAVGISAAGRHLGAEIGVVGGFDFVGHCASPLWVLTCGGIPTSGRPARRPSWRLLGVVSAVPAVGRLAVLDDAAAAAAGRGGGVARRAAPGAAAADAPGGADADAVAAPYHLCDLGIPAFAAAGGDAHDVAGADVGRGDAGAPAAVLELGGGGGGGVVGHVVVLSGVLREGSGLSVTL